MPATAIPPAHPIPALKDWNIYAGGTSAAKDKNSFQRASDKGLYGIDPVCWKNTLRHRGYIVTFADVNGLLKVGGLWSWINSKGEGSGIPQHSMTLSEAIRAVRAHYDAIK